MCISLAMFGAEYRPPHARSRCHTHAEALVTFEHTELLLQERLVERDVDEASPQPPRSPSLRLGRRDDVVGYIAWLATEPPGERQCAVGLGVGSITRPHHRIGVVYAGGDRGKRGCQQFCHDDEWISHEESIVLVYVFVRHAGLVRPCVGEERSSLSSLASRPRSSGDRAAVSGNVCAGSNPAEGATSLRPSWFNEHVEGAHQSPCRKPEAAKICETRERALCRVRSRKDLDGTAATCKRAATFRVNDHGVVHSAFRADVAGDDLTLVTPIPACSRIHASSDLQRA